MKIITDRLNSSGREIAELKGMLQAAQRKRDEDQAALTAAEGEHKNIASKLDGAGRAATELKRRFDAAVDMMNEWGAVAKHRTESRSNSVGTGAVISLVLREKHSGNPAFQGVVVSGPRGRCVGRAPVAAG